MVQFHKKKHFAGSDITLGEFSYAFLLFTGKKNTHIQMEMELNIDNNFRTNLKFSGSGVFPLLPKKELLKVVLEHYYRYVLIRPSSFQLSAYAACEMRQRHAHNHIRTITHQFLDIKIFLKIADATL